MSEFSQVTADGPQEAPGGPQKVVEVPEASTGASSSTEGPEAPRAPFWTPVRLSIAAVVLALAAALLVQFVVTPWWDNRTAAQKLTAIKGESGPLRVANTKLVTFKGQSIKNANVDQKALAVSDQATTPAAFIFDNGKQHQKVLDVYVDFSSQASRDFLLLNRNLLQNMVEAGNIELRVHPVPTGKAFSMYAAEATAESAYTTPEQTWTYMMDLLRLGATLDTDKATDLVEQIVKVAQTDGVQGIDAASIKNGTFASWFLSLGDDSRLKTGFYPPVLYLDNQLAPKNMNINNSDELRQWLNK